MTEDMTEMDLSTELKLNVESSLLN